jgi:hypothetical protein
MIADIQSIRKSEGRGEGGLRKGAVRYEAIGREGIPERWSLTDCEVIVKLTTLMRKIYYATIPS